MAILQCIIHPFITRPHVKKRRHGAAHDAGMSIAPEKSPYETTCQKLRQTGYCLIGLTHILSVTIK